MSSEDHSEVEATILRQLATAKILLQFGLDFRRKIHKGHTVARPESKFFGKRRAGISNHAIVRERSSRGGCGPASLCDFARGSRWCGSARPCGNRRACRKARTGCEVRPESRRMRWPHQ